MKSPDFFQTTVSNPCPKTSRLIIANELLGFQTKLEEKTLPPIRRPSHRCVKVGPKSPNNCILPKRKKRGDVTGWLLGLPKVGGKLVESATLPTWCGWWGEISKKRFSFMPACRKLLGRINRKEAYLAILRYRNITGSPTSTLLDGNINPKDWQVATPLVVFRVSRCFFGLFQVSTLQETNISPKNAILKMIFLFPRVGYVNPLEGIHSKS